ncbi:MAG: transposase [Pseudohongiellaceae bacterium]
MEKRKVTYRLYPSRAQRERLDALLVSHQQLYNAALQERIEAWRKCGTSISYRDQCSSLTEIRRHDLDWSSVNCSSQQMTLRRLDQAFKAFFRRVKSGQAPGFPRFKSRQRFPGFSYKGHGDGWRFTPVSGRRRRSDGSEQAIWRHGHLRLAGVGTIKARGQTPHIGAICASNVFHRGGEWYLSLTVSPKTIERKRTADKAGGFDWGVEMLLAVAYDKGGDDIGNPRIGRTDTDRITALQQAVSSKQRGSNRRRKAAARLGSAKRHQTNRRLDHQHQITARIAAEHALVAIEKITTRNMTRSARGTAEAPGRNVKQKAGLNREILDTAPGRLYQMLRYKVTETGGWFIETPTRQLKPSQRCPACWQVRKKTLSEREHACPCGHSESRDRASARVNLLWAHRQASGRESAETGSVL